MSDLCRLAKVFSFLWTMMSFITAASISYAATTLGLPFVGGVILMTVLGIGLIVLGVVLTVVVDVGWSARFVSKSQCSSENNSVRTRKRGQPDTNSPASRGFR